MIAKAQIPNLLTAARIAAVPVALVAITIDPLHYGRFLFWLFALASLTDFLDGYLARKWNAVSTLGALLDPMADKLLVALMLLYLVSIGVAPLLPIAIILLRELYIAGLREFLALRGIPLPVSKSGKWKTALQMLSILVLLYALASATTHPASADIPLGTGMHVAVGCGLLWLAAALALFSAADYTRKAWPNLR